MTTHPKECFTGTDAVTANMNMRQFKGKSIFLGPLPDNFLRVDVVGGDQFNQLQLDEELAASLQQRYDQQARSRRTWTAQYRAQLVITFVEAKLVKNYGIINMNPYIRLRVGHTIFETKTNYKGGKNPRWDETINCYLPKGVEAISIEIFDECMLTNDEIIARATYRLPERFFASENESRTFEECIPLNGKQGEGMEGNLYVVFSIKPITPSSAPIPRQPVVYQIPTVIPGTGMHPVIRPMVHRIPDPANTLLPPANEPIREDDVKALHEMFPSIERDVIKSVLASERGNLDRAINTCLELSSAI